ncbi:MAG: ATP-binding protein [Candidatus Omnitrophica bacterium]|nr:ATP-binding protein [Candidatus Omnitrophota bacterium]
MNNAKDIFDQIRKGGIDYIKNSMLNKQFEHTWIDCKQKHNKGTGILHDDDIKNFAKALSGFANGMGGVLIFGLIAKKEGNGDDAIDIVTKIQSIKGLKLFESQLREKESRLIARGIPGVEYKTLETGDDEGVLLLYIPEGSNPPYMVLKNRLFYYRAGDSFRQMDLLQIESHVLKKIKPDLHLRVNMRSRGGGGAQADRDRLNLDFKIVNEGWGVAKNVFLRILIGKNSKYRLIRSASLDHRWQILGRSKDKICDWTYDKVVHPTIYVTPDSLILEYERGHGVDYDGIPSFKIDFLLCADNMPVKKISVTEESHEMFCRFASLKTKDLLSKYVT